MPISYIDSRQTRTAGTSKPTEKTSEEQTDTAAALIHESKKGKKKGRRGPYCAPGKHNPEATSHNADHCWQLHPELRPPSSTSKGNGVSSSYPTTQLVEVDEGHESEVSMLLTEAAIQILQTGTRVWVIQMQGIKP
ncbi:hypothetical protein VP01_2976g1 [Puccinia sorghi]|uniref:Uncharacterized protein n=1 Tax=Puccinia sorghi TaxID=27349 RepID=A0A0L6V0K9_9BASI|nr:hypothetical protein VP01_2976g1 [Puccinia sorghi]